MNTNFKTVKRLVPGDAFRVPDHVKERNNCMDLPEYVNVGHIEETPDGHIKIRLELSDQVIVFDDPNTYIRIKLWS